MVDVFNTIEYFIGHIEGFCFHLLLSSGRVFVMISSTVSADRKNNNPYYISAKDRGGSSNFNFFKGVGGSELWFKSKISGRFWTFDERPAIE